MTLAEAIDNQRALFLGAGILLLSIIFQLWRSSSSRRSSPLPLPPGSYGLPFFGETLQFLYTQRRNLSWTFVDDRVSVYGEIFKTRSHCSFLKSCRVNKSAQSFLEENWHGRSEVKAFPLLKRFMFGIACELLMSRYNRQEQEMLEEPFSTMVHGQMQLPIRLPGTRYSKAITAANLLHSQFQLWIEERKRDLASGKGLPDDMLSCLLTYVRENGRPLSDEDIKDNILLMLFAGHDTSTLVTALALRYLALNPDIFDAVYRENKEILEEKGHDKPLSWADIQKMKLSWRVVQETLRLQPPSQGSFRKVIQTFEYNGFRIPNAWKLYWSVNSTHRNAKYFEEPDKFDPSRFEGAGPAPYTFVPFGGGARMCPGNEFARMVIMVLLHHIVIHFSWTLVDPHEIITVDPLPFPAKGLPINLVPRYV
ncbi:hypothetical protein GOP47_0021540 [Adiantum capillus-veneris]|uniref:Cytochrome P450 n=1 Tax=Adiantum capillus-veneris TaxID=13818 RepID=A0A9D4Z5C5_ADICA|nr:hypothetical protein GOP47_0021540 [Adiantum capillus-veneris]